MGVEVEVEAEAETGVGGWKVGVGGGMCRLARAAKGKHRKGR